MSEITVSDASRQIFFFQKGEEEKGGFDGNVSPVTIVYIHLLVLFLNVHRNIIL